MELAVYRCVLNRQRRGAGVPRRLVRGLKGRRGFRGHRCMVSLKTLQPCDFRSARDCHRYRHGDEALETFRTLKSNCIGVRSAQLYAEWASMEYATGALHGDWALGGGRFGGCECYGGGGACKMVACWPTSKIELCEQGLWVMTSSQVHAPHVDYAGVQAVPPRRHPSSTRA